MGGGGVVVGVVVGAGLEVSSAAGGTGRGERGG
jgi:hypothetical protein